MPSGLVVENGAPTRRTCGSITPGPPTQRRSEKQTRAPGWWPRQLYHCDFWYFPVAEQIYPDPTRTEFLVFKKAA